MKSTILEIKRKVINSPLIRLKIILYGVFNKPLIYVIGDSHAGSFAPDWYSQYNLFCPIIICHIGPATAYKLNDASSSTNSKRKIFGIVKRIREKDIVITVFGEIDCRIHIYNQWKKQDEKVSINQIISNTVANYGDLLKELKDLNLNLYVFNVSPTGDQDNIYGYPWYGPKETRKAITIEMNSQLKELCINNRINFIDIFHQVTDENGFRLKEYELDEVHLNNKILPLVYNELNKST